MSFRQRITLGSLALLGLAVAAAMGVLANAIAGDSIGLSAKPLRAGDQLAPATAGRPSSADEKAGSGSDRTQAEGSKPDRTQSDDTGGATTATTPPATTAEPGDDHGGVEPGDGHGGAVDNSGPGSVNSGSGSSGSGSSGDD
ncbi:MAG TPA: hypothetical protein VN458_07900 [Solirubrobacterales bacterium]|nr:hypothetical protein [Solirubrobacterales bacterium]